jgi:hypothetical protein
MLENVVLNNRQRVLHRLARWNYLSGHSSTSEYEESHYAELSKLIGYKLSGSLDKRLLKNTYKKEEIVAAEEADQTTDNALSAKST